ncbi:hypothetical protein [Aphanothece hegewaldii]|uniref:hypothetical protein n=1 Tax=Aphanothece hegewaldii TaxID=1521625 RepID=UPI0015E6BC8B|nr:hypothetical protein [Aphanothece hegewaldii]
MVPAILISPDIQEQEKVIFVHRQKSNQANQLVMQWTLDENAQLTCKWVQDKQ